MHEDAPLRVESVTVTLFAFARVVNSANVAASSFGVNGAIGIFFVVHLTLHAALDLVQQSHCLIVGRVTNVVIALW